MILMKFIPLVNIFRGKLRRKTLLTVGILVLTLHLCWHLNEEYLRCYRKDYETLRINDREDCGQNSDAVSNRSVVGCSSNYRRIFYKDDVRVMGSGPSKKVFLTIGLPTIERLYKNVAASYLELTLDSLIEALSPAELNEVHVVIFLADIKEQARNKVKQKLAQKYQHHIDTNFINVIEAQKSFYPRLKGLARTLGDSQERMFWRSKQSIDYVFLFNYCQGLSHYYLQIEDDVKTSKNFLSTIKNCIEPYKHSKWVFIQTSVWGFIGKLFKNEEMDYFARMLRIFYNDLPCDWILHKFPTWRGDRAKFSDRICGHIFEHIGNQSSSLGT